MDAKMYVYSVVYTNRTRDGASAAEPVISNRSTTTLEVLHSRAETHKGKLIYMAGKSKKSLGACTIALLVLPRELTSFFILAPTKLAEEV